MNISNAAKTVLKGSDITEAMALTIASSQGLKTVTKPFAEGLVSEGLPALADTLKAITAEGDKASAAREADKSAQSNGSVNDHALDEMRESLRGGVYANRQREEANAQSTTQTQAFFNASVECETTATYEATYECLKEEVQTNAEGIAEMLGCKLAKRKGKDKSARYELPSSFKNNASKVLYGYKNAIDFLDADNQPLEWKEFKELCQTHADKAKLVSEKPAQKLQRKASESSQNAAEAVKKITEASLEAQVIIMRGVRAWQDIHSAKPSARMAEANADALALAIETMALTPAQLAEAWKVQVAETGKNAEQMLSDAANADPVGAANVATAVAATS
jgi:hypothetical protein